MLILRLGYLESEPVTWEELSAAWGQTALLTKIIIDKMQFKIEKFTMFPLGSRSFITEKSSGNKLPLYFVQNFKTKLMGDRQFDSAIVAYRNVFHLFFFLLISGINKKYIVQ